MCAEAVTNPSVPNQPTIPGEIEDILQRFEDLTGDEDAILLAAGDIFADLPRAYHEEARVRFAKNFPEITANLAAGKAAGTADKIEDYVAAPYTPPVMSDRVCGFTRKPKETYAQGALRRYKDNMLPIWKRAYALCLLACTPSHENELAEARKLKGPMVENLKRVIETTATTRRQVEQSLGVFLAEWALTPTEGMNGAVEGIKDLRDKSAFLRDFGPTFMSVTQLDTAQAQIKSEIDALLLTADASFSGAWLRFNVKLGLQNQPPVVQNRAMGYFINDWYLCQVMESVHARQHEENLVALANYQTYLSEGGAVVQALTLDQEMAAWNNLPVTWKETMATAAHRNKLYPSGGTHCPFYVSTNNGNTKLRKWNHPKPERGDAPLAAVKTLFKDGDAFRDRVLAEKRGPNFLVPILQARHNATMQEIDRMKVDVPDPAPAPTTNGSRHGNTNPTAPAAATNAAGSPVES